MVEKINKSPNNLLLSVHMNQNATLEIRILKCNRNVWKFLDTLIKSQNSKEFTRLVIAKKFFCVNNKILKETFKKDNDLYSNC